MLLSGHSRIHIKNSIFARNHRQETIAIAPESRANLILQNSLVIGGNAVQFRSLRAGGNPAELSIIDSTIYASQCFAFQVDGPVPLNPNIRIESRGSLFQAYFLTIVQGVLAGNVGMREQRSWWQLEKRLRWRGDRNLFALRKSFAGFQLSDSRFVPGRNGPRDLKSWTSFTHGEGESSIEASTWVLGVVDPPDQIEFSPFQLVQFDSPTDFGASLPRVFDDE